MGSNVIARLVSSAVSIFIALAMSLYTSDSLALQQLFSKKMRRQSARREGVVMSGGV
jgi:hypothetical protein